jgi:hypothetical protein
MNLRSASLLVAFILSYVGAANAQEKNNKQRPVRMGCGSMTFDTVPGWGLRPDGKSAIGPTHGAVVIDQAGNIYTSARDGVFVFSPDGKVVQSYLDKDHSDIHDMEIRTEGSDEFIYAARNNNAEGIKFNAKSGEIVLRLGPPKESGLVIDSTPPQSLLHPTGISFCRMAMPPITFSSSTRRASIFCTSARKGTDSRTSIRRTA